MTLCIIQARLGSTRLPGKSLMDVGGKPLIQHVIERAQQIHGVRFVVLAVPFSDVSAFSGFGVPVYGFSDIADDDVLGRYAAVLERYPNSVTILRITGDCPLLNPRIAEQVLALYASDVATDYASNVAIGYVDGEDVEVFSAAALREAHRDAVLASDKEHVTPFIRRNGYTATLFPEADRSGLKTSVDTLEDLERVRALVSQ